VIKATYIDHMGSDLSVVNAARVSFGKQSEWKMACVGDCHGHGWRPSEDCSQCERVGLTDKDTKLIHYLAKHGHYSPFGHAFASFHVKAPIFVARQLVKHKFLRWNEVSRRYVDDEPEFYVPDVWRGRSKDKKQGSDGVSDWPPEGTGFAYLLEHRYPAISATYHRMIESGVAPEQARMVLPQSTMTEWYWSGSLDAFANMCNLRLKEDTQYETRLVAQQIDKVMGELYPVSWKALVHEQT
jgi:thymidylate synthase (FAD)